MRAVFLENPLKPTVPLWYNIYAQGMERQQAEDKARYIERRMKDDL